MQEEKDTIEIVERDGHWYAKFAGQHRMSVVRAFGVDTIPTAYAVDRSKDFVIERMRLANRGCTVF